MTSGYGPAPRPPFSERRGALYENEAFLTLAIWGTANDPSFVGHQLAALRGRRHQTPKDQADALGLTLPGLAELCLCWTPRDRADVERIAARMGWDSGLVEDLLGVQLPA